MKHQIAALVLIISSIGVQAYAGGSSTVGPGNPSTANCLKLGGTLEDLETPAGQSSHCLIEEWQLFREMAKRNLIKQHRYGNLGMPNPAAVNCADIKGSLRYVVTQSGEAGLCVVDGWDLFRAIDVLKEN